MDIANVHAAGSVVIAAPADVLYDFIADMPAIGEVSAQCVGGEWESDARGVGAYFIGSNAWRERTWKIRVRVVAADPGREFAWENLGDPGVPDPDDRLGLIRWGYTFEPTEGGTRVEETWRILRPYPELDGATPVDFERLIRNFEHAIAGTLANLKAKFES
ncbi:MAG: SRPBCC family protein [Acidimicrobiia bacterium]